MKSSSLIKPRGTGFQEAESIHLCIVVSVTVFLVCTYPWISTKTTSESPEKCNSSQKTVTHVTHFGMPSPVLRLRCCWRIFLFSSAVEAREKSVWTLISNLQARKKVPLLDFLFQSKFDEFTERGPLSTLPLITASCHHRRRTWLADFVLVMFERFKMIKMF